MLQFACFNPAFDLEALYPLLINPPPFYCGIPGIVVVSGVRVFTLKGIVSKTYGFKS